MVLSAFFFLYPANNLFLIDPETGAVRFKPGRADFEGQPDGLYAVVITAETVGLADGGGTAATQTVIIQLNDLPEAPTAISLNKLTVPFSDSDTALIAGCGHHHGDRP